ncbi:MAG: septum formation protein [Flavobacteriales bacterium]|jgi:septum formation protein
MGESLAIQLASKSPRRAELLRQLGVDFDIVDIELDESILAGETPEDYVVRVSQEKALLGFERSPVMPTLGSDTCVLVDGKVLGKPKDKLQALAYIEMLSGRGHEVLTAVALCDEVEQGYRLSRTRVYFRPITHDMAERYWATGEPQDKAGGYGIQGYGAAFIQRIEGSYSGVMGLPLAETAELLEQFNLPYWR